MGKSLALFKNHNFARFYIGSVVSQIGSIFVQFATGLFILDITGQALYMSIYYAISSVIMIVCQPFFGALSDRMDKVKVLYVIDYLSGLTDLALALLLFVTKDPTILIIGLFINGTINALMAAMYQPVYSSMIPMMMKDDELNQAYSFTATLGNFQHIIGILLASVLYANLGYKWLLVLNGISFVIAAMMEMKINLVYEAKGTSSSGFKALLNDVKSGYHYMNEKKELINMARVAVTMNFFLVGIFGITLQYMIYQTLNLEPYILASMNIAMSIGGILMALRVANADVSNAGDRIFLGFLWGFVCLVGVTATFWLVDANIITSMWFVILLALVLFSFGASGSYIQIPLNTAYAKRVEPEMMGRVMALRQTLSSIASPLSMLVFGAILDYSTVHVALVFGTLGIGGATFFAKMNPHIRGLNDKKEVA